MPLGVAVGSTAVSKIASGERYTNSSMDLSWEKFMRVVMGNRYLDSVNREIGLCRYFDTCRWHLQGKVSVKQPRPTWLSNLSFFSGAIFGSNINGYYSSLGLWILFLQAHASHVSIHAISALLDTEVLMYHDNLLMNLKLNH